MLRNLVLLLVVVFGFGASSFASTIATVIVGGPGEHEVSGAWDSGNLTISFSDAAGDNYSATVTYGQFSTFASVASAFGAKFSANYYCARLWAYASGNTITIVDKTDSGPGVISISGPTESFSLTQSAWSTSVSFGSSVNPSSLDANVNLTAVVSPSTSTGTVTFTDGGSFLATAPVISGIASFSTESLSAGSHSITATYNGNSAYLPSTSLVLIQQVLSGPVPTPTFSPTPGTYASTQLVTINDSLSGAMIYFTTDGSTPTQSSSMYTEPISVGASMTIKAIAVLSGWVQSQVSTATYTIAPSGGTLNIFLSPPGAQSTAVSGVATETFDALSTGIHTAAFASPAGIGTYIGSSSAPFAILSHDLYGGATDSAHSSPTNYLAIGNATNSTAPVTLNLAQPAAYFGFWWSAGDAVNHMDLYSGDTLYLSLSTADLKAFLNNGVGTVTAINGTPYQANAYFGNPNLSSGSNDGSEPFAYVSFVIAGATIDKIDFYNSNTLSAFESDNHSVIFVGNPVSIPGSYVPVESLPLTPTAAQPVFSPIGGSYTSPQTVTISSATAGASINYTTDGTTPSATSGQLYTGPVSVNSTEAIQAIAYKTGYTNSALASATYTFPTSVSITPSSATLYAGGSQSFTATVAGNSNTNVTWTLNPATGAGTISISGNTAQFTAPANIATQQVVTITATSQADTTKSASAAITLTTLQCQTGGYQYVRAIDIDHTKVPNTDQVSFPFLFSTTDIKFATVSNGGHVTNANGYDIIFSSDPAGQSKLSFEIEKYDPAIGQLIAWVKIPSLSHSTDTVIYLLYGNSSISSPQQTASAVWDANYQSVWHLENGTQLSLTDSTTHADNATSNGAVAVAGVIDGGMQTDGTTYATIGIPANLANLGHGSATFSAWVNPATPGGMVLGKGGFSEGGWTLGLDGSNYAQMIVYDGFGGNIQSYAPLPSGWSFIVATLANDPIDPSQSTVSLYVNGSLSSSSVMSIYSPVDDTSAPAYIANNDYGNFNEHVGSPIDGNLDEVRISNNARSADWIATEFNNQVAPEAFYTLLPEGFKGVAPPSPTLYAAQTEQFAVAGYCGSPVAVWSLSSGAPGSISTSGIYQAPSSIAVQESVTVTASDEASGSNLGTSAVTLMPPVVISVSPASTTIQMSMSTIQFSANVLNATNSDVSWSVTPSYAGTITRSGLYTAPYLDSPTTVTITATSQADPSKSASATVSLAPLEVAPSGGSIYGGFSQQFTATVPVNWSIAPAGLGTITAAGLYTAPANTTQEQTVTVTATSQAYPELSVSAVVGVSPPVSLDPVMATLSEGQTAAFSACVATSAISMSCGYGVGQFSMSPAGAGILTSAGMYYAPKRISTPQTVLVTASDPANPVAAATATVHLIPPTIGVAPSSATLYASQTMQYQANVTNGTATPMIWSISPAQAGSISSSGLYQAPPNINTPTTVTITATSQASPAISGTAIVTLSPIPCAAQAYSYTRSIIIDHTKVAHTDQVDFPVLFSATDLSFKSASNGGHIQSDNGFDIAFSTDPAGKSTLDYELEKYDPVSGQVLAWIRVPNLSHLSDTIIYMFYGNPNITAAQQHVTDVWKSKFSAVYHFDGAASGVNLDDSTDNRMNGASANAGITEITAGDGMFGMGSATFNAYSQVSLPAFSFGTFTVASWIRPTTTGQVGTVLVGPPGGVEVEIGTDQSVHLLPDEQSDILVSSAKLTPNVWNHVAVTYDSMSARVYVNGDLSGTTGYSSIFAAGGYGLGHGNDQVAGFIGSLDELQISSTARSSDWIRTQFNNQSNPGSFLRFGGENSAAVLPSAISLYASQQQLFTPPSSGGCDDVAAIWSMPAGAPGTLSDAGLYTAPSTISKQQTVSITATTLGTLAQPYPATVTLLPPISIGVTPSTVSLAAGQTQTFSAQVANAINANITWTVSPDGVGTISASGVYTAPTSIAATQSVTITATSQQDTANSASASVTLIPDSLPVGVSISPSDVKVAAGQTKQFVATVSNSSNTQVNWIISPAEAGSINANGLYTAPATVSSSQVVTVVAISQADPSKSAYATVDLSPTQCSSSGATFKSMVVIDHMKVQNSDQTNFPFLYSTTDASFASVANGGHVASSSGYDIYFSLNPDGSSKLDHEIEKYDPVTGQLIAWIRIPTLSHDVDTVVYMFYGDGAPVASLENAPGVWDADFEAVYHLGGIQGSATSDSTAYANSANLTSVSASTGVLNSGAAFNGTSSYLQIPSAAFPNYPTGVYENIGIEQNATSTPFTATFGGWFKTSSPGGILMQVPQQSQSCALNTCTWETVTPGYSDPAGWAPLMYVDDNGKLEAGSIVSPISYMDDVWHYAVVTYSTDGSDTLYVDGQVVGTEQNRFPTGYSSAYSYFVGADYTLLGPQGNWDWLYFNGGLDEIRVSDTARSADWVRTEFNNQNSPSTFYRVFSAGTAKVVPPSASLYPNQTEQLAVAGACVNTFSWSMPLNSLGSLSSNGTYTAPASIATQQSVTITVSDQSSGATIGSSAITLMPPPPPIELNATSSAPYVVGTSRAFEAVLKDPTGSPESGIVVTFNVSGANSVIESVTTDRTGTAAFSYPGTNSGTDTIQASAVVNGELVNSNSLSASWISPAQTAGESVTLVPSPALGIGGLAGAFTDGSGTVIQPIAIGAGRSEFIVPAGATQLQLGINDAHYADNTSAGFVVKVNGNPITIPSTTMPWTWQTGGLNNGYQYGMRDGTNPVVAATSLTAGSTITVAYQSGTVSPGLPLPALTNANGNQALTTDTVEAPGAYFPTLYTTPTAYPLGQPVSFNTVVTDGSGAPLANVPVTINITGANPGQYQVTTDSTGVATLTYQGAYVGSDVLQAQVSPTGSSTLTSNESTVTWIGYPTPPAIGSLTLSYFGTDVNLQDYTVLAKDSSGNPIANANIGLYVSGVDNFQVSGVTDATGHVAFSYYHANPGNFSIVAVATVDRNVILSNTVTGTWSTPSNTVSGTTNSLTIGISANNSVTLPATLQLNGSVADNLGLTPSISWSVISGPASVSFDNPQSAVTTATFTFPGNYVLQLSASDTVSAGSVQLPVAVYANPHPTGGWIASPTYGETVSGLVPITLVPGITLQSGTLSFYPVSNPNSVTTLNANVSGSGQIGLLDATTLPNGSYIIQLQSTQIGGDSEYDVVLVNVAGDYKPGRLTTTVTDLVVPATGMAISIQRSYDSLNANSVGDFGYGWNLSTNVNLQVDTEGNVTFTLGGRRRTFYLAPQSLGSVFSFLYLPAYTAEPGLTGTLSDEGSGCFNALDFVQPDGALWLCPDGTPYAPSQYTYTDPTGTVYSIGAGGSLQSIADKNGNGLTITANGITSSTGLSVPFVRDGSGRITQITDPQGNNYLYSYDSNGNLATVAYPETPTGQICSGLTSPNTSQYTYYPNSEHPNYPAHFYAGGTDGRCNPLPSTDYYGPNDTDTNGLPLNGRLKGVTDALGEITTYAYNLATTTTTITYPDNGTVTMVYDTSGDLLSSTDQLSHTTTYTYDSRRNQTSVTDPLGHMTSFAYDSNGNKTSTTYPATGSSTNTTSMIVYGQYGEPLTISDENGNVRNFTYDANMHPQSETDTINGQTATIATSIYNSSGQIQALAIGADLTKNPAIASTFTYDSNGNIASATDPLGRTTSFTYDSLGHRLSMVRSAGSNSIPQTGASSSQFRMANVSTRGIHGSSKLANKKTSAQPNTLTPLAPSSQSSGAACDPTTPPPYTVSYVYSVLYGISSEVDSLGRSSSALYDENGNTTSYTDANGNAYTYVYDALNRLTQVNLPTNPATSYRFTYDSNNHVIDVIDPEGHDRRNAYDGAGRLTSVTLAYGTSSATKTNLAYYDDGRLESVTDAAGHATNYTYDAAGNLTRIARGTVSMQYAYDNARNRISATDGNGNTTSFEYDARSHLQQIGLADHTHESITYDDAGNVTGVTDQAGHNITYGYDSSNRLMSVTQANSPSTSNNTVSYCRDGMGNLASWSDENGHVTTQKADALGRPTALTFPDGVNGLIGSYDGNSNLVMLDKTSSSSLLEANFAYDGLNRLISETPDASYGEIPAHFTYTANGLLSTMTDSSGTTNYTYDALDRLVIKAAPAGTLNYSYDEVGNVATMSSTGANAVSVSYAYDALNRLSTVVDNNLPMGHNTTTYSYDPASNLATATYPNGLQAIYAYDDLNRLSRASTAVSDYQYQRDENGNILTATEADNRTSTYLYNGIDELTKETVANDTANTNGVVDYDLDPVGNRLSQTSSLAPVDSWSTSFSADDWQQAESYDANGDTVSTGGNTYAYNSWLKLVSMNGSQVWLTYNGLGQLTAKTANGVTTQYLVDDLSPTGYPQIVEEIAGGAVKRTYTYGYERISQSQTVDSAWTPSFYVYDGRGTVRMLANSAGQVTDTYQYDAFGNLLNKTGSTPNVYLYRGERYDADLNLYYLRARWYNPATGRFMSRDPYGGNIYDPASLHRYNYARVNPVNYIDPSGRSAAVEFSLSFGKDIVSAAGLAVAGRVVGCTYAAEASMLYLLFDAPFVTREQAELLSDKLDVTKCAAQITVKQVVQDTLLNLMFGWAVEGFGRLLGDAEQGVPAICNLCFAAGTPVHTDHGAVPIERIKVGDKVWARNEKTGATELRNVTAVAPQHRDTLIELRVEGEKNALRATPVHPFRARMNANSTAHWIDAGDLVAGEQIETQNGRWVAVQSETSIKGLSVVYNFTVGEDHDYFVGDQGLLVHNDASYPDWRRPYLQQWVRDAVEEAQEYTEEGLRIDPNTGIPYAGPPHLGHKPGFEWWRLRDMAEREGLTQQELNELAQDPELYQYENPISNMSHACEIP